MDKFLDELQKSIPFLIEERNFKLVEEIYERAHFGNGIAVFEASDFRIRFIKDRGQFFSQIEAISDKDAWWELNYICVLLSIPDTFSHDLSNVVLQAQIIRSKYELISEAFNKMNLDKTKAHLRAISEERVSKLKETFRAKS